MYTNLIQYIKNVVAIIFLINTLNTCGVQLQSDKNIALHKPASQSSTFQTSIANFSVDGNFTQDHHYCAHGGDEKETTFNWLMVDLLDEYYISEVILTPRNVSSGSNNENKRIDYVFIGISNSPYTSRTNKYPTYPLCRQSPYTVNTTTFENISILCRPNAPPGRYIIVQQPSKQYSFLTVCEFQVFGMKLENSINGNNTCKGNYYGNKCDKYCNCKDEIKCFENGTCPNGCADNWEGNHCDIRKYNNNQEIGCVQFEGGLFNIYSSTCNVTCEGYGFTFAANMNATFCICTNTLNKNCQTNQENSQNTSILYSVCPSGSYGYSCTLRCHCQNYGRCSYMEGLCEDRCADGWTSQSCNIRGNQQSVNKPAIIGGVIGSFTALFIVGILIIIFVKFKKRFNPFSQKKVLSKFENSNVIPPTANSNELGGDVIKNETRSIELKNMHEYVEQNRNHFSTDYQNIYKGDISQLYYSKEKKLNRFKNIYPYKHNRIKIERKPGEHKSDYINASYIKNVIDDTLIACQGPTIPTIEDFWTMVCQQNIGIVIMLCNFVEGKKMKCEQYFPKEYSLKYGDYTIQHLSTRIWPSYKITDLKIYNPYGQQRNISHLHFTAWPDHGVPENVVYFLDFLRRCQKSYEKEKCGMAVHCSAGIGRTGTFIAIFDLLLKSHQNLSLNVPETVNNLRRQRIKMVENEIQYNFIHDALVAEVMLGQTSFSKKEYIKFYNEIDKNEKMKFHYQLEILSKYLSKNEYYVDTKDDFKTMMTSTSAYKFCILTKSVDSWKMNHELQCFLLFGMENTDSFNPKLDEPIIEKQICFSLVKEEQSDWGKIIEIKRKFFNDLTYANVTSYENINFEREKNIKLLLFDQKEDYLDFLNFMELFQQIQNYDQIGVFMGNNFKLGYFVMALCNIISQLKVYDEVAIFQNLCELYKIVCYQPSQISFEKLHQILYEFILTSN